MHRLRVSYPSLRPGAVMSDLIDPNDPFYLPMRSLDDAQTIVREIEALLRQRQLSLRPPPEVPTTCCGVGCGHCVWQWYYEALANWRDQARTLCGDGPVAAADAACRR